VQALGRYIWGDPLPDFTAPELPKKDEKKADGKLASFASGY
jgi:hypothetical protein